jgi:GABA(A) receptor-associated protein
MNIEKRDYALRLLKKYPNSIPIVLKKSGINTPDIDKYKFMVPREMQISQFIYTIRKRIKIREDQALFIFFRGELVNSASTLYEVYENHKSDDDILYGFYSLENTFG